MIYDYASWQHKMNEKHVYSYLSRVSTHDLNLCYPCKYSSCSAHNKSPKRHNMTPDKNTQTAFDICKRAQLKSSQSPCQLCAIIIVRNKSKLTAKMRTLSTTLAFGVDPRTLYLSVLKLIAFSLI